MAKWKKIAILKGSPDTADEIKNKLETLKDEARLDVSAIKGLAVTKSGRPNVGGIRYFEQLADVSIPIADKRQDEIAQYNTTNNRWEGGIAITVGTVAPTNPKINDLFIDIS